ncbi:MAG: M48 family metallopeptidase [Bdellovibrionales bacterium]|nr:M48 family metallopeptidase [Bdellovibrionales bacterium]
MSFVKNLFKLVLCSLLIQLSACSSMGRRTVEPGVVPPARSLSTEDEQYGHEVLNKLSEKWELDYDHPRYAEIRKVVDRLTAAAKADQNPWHVYLFKAPDVMNAAATRGNHIFVWSGMLDFATSEEELATVLAHEIAHVLAGHTDPDPNEAIRQLLIGVGATAAGIAVATAAGGAAGQVTSALTQEVGSGFLVNPYSRDREAEADHIGLFLMADAKYDPNAAIQFWDKASKNPNFNTSIEFFSTHPLAGDRMNNLARYLPQALDRYNGVSSAPLPQSSVVPQSSQQPRRDSFSVDGPARSGTNKGWEVTAHRAVLYASPELSAKRLGEFAKGARVSGKPARKGWLEIFAPDHGYLRTSDLRQQ